MLEDTPSPPQSDDPLFQIEGVKGTCRVMCFYPKSNVTIALMSINDIVTVISRYILKCINIIFHFNYFYFSVGYNNWKN